MPVTDTRIHGHSLLCSWDRLQLLLVAHHQLRRQPGAAAPLARHWQTCFVTCTMAARFIVLAVSATAVLFVLLAAASASAAGVSAGMVLILNANNRNWY